MLNKRCGASSFTSHFLQHGSESVAHHSAATPGTETRLRCWMEALKGRWLEEGRLKDESIQPFSTKRGPLCI